MSNDRFARRGYAPMLIGKSAECFDDENFIYEIKYDGLRTLVYADRGGGDIFSRRQQRYTDRFPEFKLYYSVPVVLDAELVVLQEEGPDFAAVAGRAMAKSCFKERSEKTPASLIVFDLLYCGGEDLTSLPLFKRKERLKKVFERERNIFLIDSVEREGTELFKAAQKLGLEGVVAKRRDSIYRPGERVDYWIKCKSVQDDDFVVVGCRKTGSGYTLSLAQKKGARLRYCGAVSCYQGIETLRRCEPYPVEGLGAARGFYVVPDQICTVSFLAWTKAGHLRHPVFKSWRPDA